MGERSETEFDWSKPYRKPEQEHNANSIEFVDSEIAIDIFNILMHVHNNSFIDLFLDVQFLDILMTISYRSPSCNYKMTQSVLKIFNQENTKELLSTLLEQPRCRAIFICFL